MSVPQLFLIDAHALCYRAFYAIKGLSTRQGQPTNAVYGFLTTLRKLLKTYQPAYAAVCFDLGGRSRRQEKFAAYKIQRPPMPDALISQVALIKEMVEAHNLTILEREGYEADDLIAAAAKGFPQVETVIVSDDKDMLQLAGERVKVFSLRRDEILNPEQMRAVLGVDPAYVPDFIALAGDTSDNIPGVPGIGEVSARNLIQAHGHLDEIYAQLESVQPERLRERLRQEREAAYLSRDLALLQTEIPLEVTLEQCAVREPDQKKLFDLFTRLEFRRQAAEAAEALGIAGVQVTVHKIHDPAAAERLAAEIRRQEAFAFLIEPPSDGGELSFLPRPLILALNPSTVYEVDAACCSALGAVFAEPRVLKITHGLKAQFRDLRDLQCEAQGRIFDVMLAGYLLAPAGGGFDLPGLAGTYLQTPLSGEDRRAQAAALLWPLRETLEGLLRERELIPLFEEIEVPLALVLARMEGEGIRLDEDLLRDLSQECSLKINGLMKDLFTAAGEEFNLNSPKQLSHVLFERLKLPVIKRTKTGFSTDEEVLTRLAAQHPLPAMILEYRQLAKLKSTYIDALPRLVDPATGRIHGVFNQTGTETGRLSSNNPNLQNIPVRTDLGRQIRRAFVASEPDRLLVAADYSQIELRILAHLAQDERLIQAFRRDEDIHRATAARIFDVEEKDVTSQMRYSAKRVNFGIIYGMSAFGLAKDLSIPQPQAQAFIDRYFLLYPGVKTFMNEEIRKCEERGFVTTLLNRRRYIPEIKSSNMSERQFAQRQAINTPVQGSAADLIKLAMIRMDTALAERGLVSRMILTVHDELVFDTVPGERDVLAGLIREQMEHSMTLSVPLKVSVKQGKNWLDMEPVPEPEHSGR